MLRRAATPACLARLLALLVVSFAALAPAASAQAPAEPANGARIVDDSVVLRWTLEPGWRSECVQWSARPETSYPGGPFLDPDATVCDEIGYQDVAYLLKELDIRRYWWHVNASHVSCPDPAQDCTSEYTWGAPVYFDSVAPPPPPPPTGCSARAADYVAYELLLPYAHKHYRRYYNMVGDDAWGQPKRICRDLNGDGNKDMIVRLLCCTGGSLTPWAIFTHDQAGQWQMKYAQVRDDVFQMRLRGRTIRTMLPFPYEGACTDKVRYREVRWNGNRFRSKLTGRRHIKTRC
jgi:hypothetical protein